MLRNAARVPAVQLAYAAVQSLLAENIAISHLHFGCGGCHHQLKRGCFLLTLAASTFGGSKKTNVVD